MKRLFQPAHGSAPDIIGSDESTPRRHIKCGAYVELLSEKFDSQPYEDAALMIERSIHSGFGQRGCDQ